MYETKTNPSIRIRSRIADRLPGRKGVVAIVRVITEVDKHDGGPEVLVDGRVHDWRFRAKTELERLCHIPLDELRIALRESRWSARVAGGLMAIDKEQFERILRLC